jgi:hypothetical protein
MSLRATKKLKTAGEHHDRADATNQAGTTIEGVDRTDGDNNRVTGSEDATATTATGAVAPDDAALASDAVPDAVLARILRRREEPTLPRVRLGFGRVVEYEFVDDYSLLHIDHEQSERLISLLIDRERENEEDSAVWLSDRCFLGLGCPLSRHPAQPWHISCNLHFSRDWPTHRNLNRIYLLGTTNRRRRCTDAYFEQAQGNH